MLKDIRYSGYTTEPSDYECSDGQLAASLNFINEDGQLKPLFQPSVLFTIPQDSVIRYIHKSSSFVHYIISYNNKLYYIDEPEAGTIITTSDFVDDGVNKNLLHDFGAATINEITSIGLTIIVLASDGMHYILWKNPTDRYKYLGDHLPELSLSFGLQGKVVEIDPNSNVVNLIHGISGGLTQETHYLHEDDIEPVTNQILAGVNKFLEEAKEEGYFVEPFFVRYAYRLNDGSLVMHSSPILMVCSTDAVPVVSVGGYIVRNNESNNFLYRLLAIRHKLDYIANDASEIPALQEWSDIVRSVDVFITKPIRIYNQNGKVKGFERNFLDVNGHIKENNISICKITNQDTEEFPTTLFPLIYQRHHISEAHIMAYPTKDNNNRYRLPVYNFMLPKYDTDIVNQSIKDESTFYLLTSLNIEDIATSERQIISIPKDYLKTLVNREVMSDDYRSHDKIIPNKSFVYNSRLNITGLTRQLYKGAPANVVLCYENGYKRLLTPSYYDGEADEPMAGGEKDTSSIDRGAWYTEIFVQIEEDGKTFVVKCDEKSVGLWWRGQGNNATMDLVPDVMYFFSPNPNAKKAYVHVYGPYISGFDRVFEYPLQQHNMLNGAFYFNGFDVPTEVANYPSATLNNTIQLPNKIYTSEVNNPFYFPVLGINTVGTGTILGICSAVKALSQGQFGQFPLYAFTTEGVWALEVSSTGTYSARQPITQDVCINADSITQLDSEVLFATDRGIMLLTGSQATCITDNINAQQPFNVLDLPGFTELHAKLGHTDDTCFPTKPFLEYLKGCRMIYDYIHQRVIMYNPTTVTNNGVTTRKYTYAYVYSLKSRMWGMTFTNINSSINSYPDALAMSDGNYIVTFGDTDETISKGIFVTRPLKLDAPDIYKTIYTILQRGKMKRNHVSCILYGSNDLYTWLPVWSSKDSTMRNFGGSPYKYFRIAVIGSLEKDETITGCTIDYQPKLTNRLR